MEWYERWEFEEQEDGTWLKESDGLVIKVNNDRIGAYTIYGELHLIQNSMELENLIEQIFPDIY